MLFFDNELARAAKLTSGLQSGVETLNNALKRRDTVSIDKYST